MAENDTEARRIVVGVDFSGRAAYAALWAAREARDRGVPVLDLVHVTGVRAVSVQAGAASGCLDTPEAVGAVLLDAVAGLVRQEYPDLSVTSEVCQGSASDRLVRLSERAELTVVATRGHGGSIGQLLGSVSLALAARSRGPAVIVRGDWNRAPLNEIVLALASDQERPPVEFAFASAAQLGAEIRAVHAWGPADGHRLDPDASDAWSHDRGYAEEVQVLLKEWQAEYPGVPVTVDAVRGDPVAVLTEAARGSRMLVLGVHRGGRPGSGELSYVVRGLLSHSATPVALVPVL